MVECIRHEGEIYAFIEQLDGDGIVRLVLTPAVVRALNRQQEYLSARAKSSSSKAAMKVRMQNGFMPKFGKKSG